MSPAGIFNRLVWLERVTRRFYSDQCYTLPIHQFSFWSTRGTLKSIYCQNPNLTSTQRLGLTWKWLYKPPPPPGSNFPVNLQTLFAGNSQTHRKSCGIWILCLKQFKRSTNIWQKIWKDERLLTTTKYKRISNDKKSNNNDNNNDDIMT